MELYSGDTCELIKSLENKGYKHTYIDGGTTIQHFLNQKLINELTITKAPILLGDGVSLFGKLNNEIKLEKSSATSFANDFIQEKYIVNYSL